MAMRRPTSAAAAQGLHKDYSLFYTLGIACVAGAYTHTRSLQSST